MGSLILDIQQIHLRKARSPRHRHQAGAIQTNPIVKLPAELFSFIEFHRRLCGKIARIGHLRFEVSQIFSKRANRFENKQRMLVVIQHTEEQNAVEAPQFQHRRVANIHETVIRVRAQ